MEPFINILLQQTPLVIVLGVVIYFQYKENKDLKTENKTLRDDAISREKEISEERREDLVSFMTAVNKNNQSIKELTNHLRNGNIQ